jgi:3-oxoacyl-[acyl-carrier protein] reductase
MNLGIAGKVALVTASGTGLGKAAAHALAAEGAKLVLFSRSADTLRATALEIQKQHKVPVIAVAGNMSSESDIATLADRLRTEFGGLDILVLNTGRPPHPLRVVLDENDNARWNDAYRTQLWSATLVAREIVPLMLDRGWGRVVAITSASVKQPMLNHGLSTIFRAGLTGYLKHLANEIAAKGVTVNMVCPASVVTSDRPGTYDVAERLKGIPLGRLGKPDDVAAAVAFLASDHAGFITGASLNIDGGMVAALQ